MKSIFPIIDNINSNHNKTSYKLKKLKLNSNKRLNTHNNFGNYNSIKTNILNNFTKSNSTNIKCFRNNNRNFMATVEDFSQRVKEQSIK